jgi:hypothetical protein
MGINSPSDVAANIQIGPTDEGMVRIYVEAEPLFDDPSARALEPGGRGRCRLELGPDGGL